MKVIIDRFEGDFSVVELPNNTFVKVPKVLFPTAFEGDVIDITINKDKTNERKKEIQNKFDKLLE